MLELNQVYCGDCLEVMKEIEDGTVDMICCDLPYGTTACKWDSIIPFDLLWKQYKRIIKKNAAIVLFGSQPFTSALGASNIQMLRYSYVWEKSRATGHLNAKKMPMKSIEDILIFYTTQPIYNPQGVRSCDLTQCNSLSDSMRGKTTDPTSVISGGIDFGLYTQTQTNYPRQIITISNDGNTFHPTQKPVALIKYLIETYTNKGDLVLDNCAGSGTTGVACKITKRNFILIEQEEEYVKIARQRIKNPDYKPTKPKTKQQPGLFDWDELDTEIK